MRLFLCPHPNLLLLFTYLCYRVKYITAILLLCSISYQFTAKLSMVAWYNINKEYVAATLCENKDKPELDCEGQCFLEKKLAQVENEQDGENNLPSKEFKTKLPPFIITTTSIIYTTLHSVADKEASLYQNLYKFHLISSIFHPPNLC